MEPLVSFGIYKNETCELLLPSGGKLRVESSKWSFDPVCVPEQGNGYGTQNAIGQTAFRIILPGGFLA